MHRMAENRGAKTSESTVVPCPCRPTTIRPLIHSTASSKPRAAPDAGFAPDAILPECLVPTRRLPSPHWPRQLLVLGLHRSTSTAQTQAALEGAFYERWFRCFAVRAPATHGPVAPSTDCTLNDPPELYTKMTLEAHMHSDSARSSQDLRRGLNLQG